MVGQWLHIYGVWVDHIRLQASGELVGSCQLHIYGVWVGHIRLQASWLTVLHIYGVWVGYIRLQASGGASGLLPVAHIREMG